MKAGVWHLSLFCNPNLSVAENGNANIDVFCAGLNSSNTAGLHTKKKSLFIPHLFFQFASVCHYKAGPTPHIVFFPSHLNF